MCSDRRHTKTRQTNRFRSFPIGRDGSPAFRQPCKLASLFELNTSILAFSVYCILFVCCKGLVRTRRRENQVRVRNGGRRHQPRGQVYGEGQRSHSMRRGHARLGEEYAKQKYERIHRTVIPHSYIQHCNAALLHRTIIPYNHTAQLHRTVIPRNYKARLFEALNVTRSRTPW